MPSLRHSARSTVLWKVDGASGVTSSVHSCADAGRYPENVMIDVPSIPVASALHGRHRPTLAR